MSSDGFERGWVGVVREGMAREMGGRAYGHGEVVGSRVFSFGAREFPAGELLSSVVGLCYDRPTASIPDELLLPFAIDDAVLKADWLSERHTTRDTVEQCHCMPLFQGGECCRRR